VVYALPKISEARNLSDEELAQAIIDVKKLISVAVAKATRQLDKPHQFKHNKHRLAQLLSVEHERKLAAAQSSIGCRCRTIVGNYGSQRKSWLGNER